MYKFNEEEVEKIENFINNNELIMRQLEIRSTDENKEYDVTPLVKLYSVFLEDGRSLEEFLGELLVSTTDINEIMKYVIGG